VTACDACLRRAWLLGRLGAHLKPLRAGRSADVTALLALSDEDLIDAVGGERRTALHRDMARLDTAGYLAHCESLALATICEHDSRYPPLLRDLEAPPATLHIAGHPQLVLGSDPTVAIVGARRASPYGLEVARALGRELSVAGVTVVSGMALGTDSAAHGGALDGGGRTVAVLGGGANVPYPRGKTRLHSELVKDACVISEMPPDFAPHPWCFPARNRIIAALAAVVVVVEGNQRSGSLITARWAVELGREVAAVPGRITSPVAKGPHELIRDGAHIVSGAGDVLDLLFGAGGGRAPSRPDPIDGLDARLRDVLRAVGDGAATVPALAAACPQIEDHLVALAELELLGLVRREDGVRYVPAGLAAGTGSE
jgi:DNA processing protein